MAFIETFENFLKVMIRTLTQISSSTKIQEIIVVIKYHLTLNYLVNLTMILINVDVIEY